MIASDRETKELTDAAEGTSSVESAVYSVPEAGKILSLGRSSAFAAAARGDIPTIRIGGRLLVPKKALERLLDTAQG